MSDQGKETETEDGGEGEGMVPRSQIRKLEDKAARVDELEAKLAERDRKDAFRDAGVDLKDPKAKYFMAGYDGEVEADAIRKQALEDGFLTPEDNESEEEVVTDEERDHATKSEEARTGAGADETPDEDPGQVARQEFDNTIKTRPRDEAGAAAIASLATAAASGDKRVLVGN